MSSLMDSVDLRTQMAGRNRMELLLFKLGGRQPFGINVFKVQEVIQCPALTKIPHSHPAVRGIANMRGKTLSVVDLAMAIGKQPLTDTDDCYVIITEYNRKIQGFLVSAVDRIVNMNWEEILPPPKGSGCQSYMTAVTNVDKQLIEIIDVEKVLSDIIGAQEDVSSTVLTEGDTEHLGQSLQKTILVVDDSSVARNQIKRTLVQIGYSCIMAQNGKEALNLLQQWAEEDAVSEHVAMVISDIEMPVMDGYTFTTEVRKDPRLKNVYMLLHTSLSGVFNNAMVDRVGADRFIPKFNADELATAVMASIQVVEERSTASV